MNPFIFHQDLQGPSNILSGNTKPFIPTMKRTYDSRASSASPPDSNQSTPKKINLSQSEGSSPEYSVNSWHNSPTSDEPVDIVSINILNATYFKCKNDLLIMHTKKSQTYNKLKYLLENVLPIKRKMISLT